MKIKTLFIVLLVLMGTFLIEPIFTDKPVFAITYTETGKINSGDVVSFSAAEPVTPAVPQRSHAPELSSLILMMSGLGGMLIRFVRRSFDRFKRIADIILSLVALVIASPILLIVGILIKINSNGPIIYQQCRVGKNHKIFKIYKLRTMRVDAERFTGAVWARKNDSRITPIGKFLRKTHLDEIPQFINVLKGEMSIVGPRPERPEMVTTLKKLIRDYEKRLQVNPGITGLSQAVHKYDETIDDVKKKIKYDLLYIRKMCFWTDFTILARTCVVVLTGKGAR